MASDTYLSLVPCCLSCQFCISVCRLFFFSWVFLFSSFSFKFLPLFFVSLFVSSCIFLLISLFRLFFLSAFYFLYPLPLALFHSFHFFLESFQSLSPSTYTLHFRHSSTAPPFLPTTSSITLLYPLLLPSTPSRLHHST